MFYMQCYKKYKNEHLLIAKFLMFGLEIFVISLFKNYIIKPIKNNFKLVRLLTN